MSASSSIETYAIIVRWQRESLSRKPICDLVKASPVYQKIPCPYYLRVPAKVESANRFLKLKLFKLSDTFGISWPKILPLPFRALPYSLPEFMYLLSLNWALAGPCLKNTSTGPQLLYFTADVADTAEEHLVCSVLPWTYTGCFPAPIIYLGPWMS